jgi:hypothetical protein
VLKDESQSEFDALLSGLCDYFQPVGAFEEGLVELLAVTRWRQRRLLIAEAAEIQAGGEFIEWDEEQRQLADANNIVDVKRLNVGLMRQVANSRVLQTCLSLLAELESKFEKSGFEHEDNTLFLSRLYGNFYVKHCEDTLYRSYLIWSQLAGLPEDVRKQNGNPSPQDCKEYFLEELYEEWKRLKDFQEKKTSNESHRMKLESLRRNVPDSPRLDQLLRYAASLERTFDRTLSQLERAQARRLGQPVAPRIDVNVSSL